MICVSTNLLLVALLPKKFQITKNIQVVPKEHVSCVVLCVHVGCPCVCPFVCSTCGSLYVRPFVRTWFPFDNKILLTDFIHIFANVLAWEWSWANFRLCLTELWHLSVYKNKF